MTATPRLVYPAHYGDLRANATQWWALQGARIRLTLTAGAAKRAGWGTSDDHLSTGLAAIKIAERAAARATMKALPAVYPAVAQLVEETRGLGAAVALFLGLIPPLRRLEEFPGFPCPSALWAYAGLSAERRTKCDRRARMIAIAYIATPTILRSADGKALYQARRAATTDRGWTKMHAHRDAIRYVAKRILRALWICRLPAASPEQLRAAQLAITVAGALSSPLDTRLALENPARDEASAPESDGQSTLVLTPDVHVSAPEPDAHPSSELRPTNQLSAPELDTQPDQFLASDKKLSAPEPASAPTDVVAPKLTLGAPESAAQPKAAISPRPSLAAPEPAVQPLDHLSPDVSSKAPGPVSSPELLLRPVHHVSAPEDGPTNMSTEFYEDRAQ